MADETKTQRRTIGEGDDDILPGSRGDTAHIEPFGCVRQCRVCGCLVGGGPTACVRCVRDEERAEREQPATAPASPWVRAKHRQPPKGSWSPVRQIGHEYTGWYSDGRVDLRSIYEWYDFAAVDRIAAENAELRRITGEAIVERDAYKRERDLLRVDSESANRNWAEMVRQRDEARAEGDRARRLRDGDGRIMDALRRERDEARAEVARLRGVVDEMDRAIITALDGMSADLLARHNAFVADVTAARAALEGRSDV